MKCPTCQTDNKDQAKNCRKCGGNLQLAPLWQPTWQWHRKSLVIIYIGVIAFFVGMRIFMKPYTRKLPPEVIPWVHGDSSAKK